MPTDDDPARQDDNYGPVILAYADGPMRVMSGQPIPMLHLEDFPTNGAMLERAKALFGSGAFFSPHVIDLDDRVVFAEYDLRRRCLEDFL
jgi:hypothetical protein